jgi:hypothetical protein
VAYQEDLDEQNDDILGETSATVSHDVDTKEENRHPRSRPVDAYQEQ